MTAAAGPPGAADVQRRPADGRVTVQLASRLTNTIVTSSSCGAVPAKERTSSSRRLEIADAGTPKEQAKAPGEDRDLLWRWNAYWRYEQVEQGVLVECESITLSRTVPILLRPVASLLVPRVARESMDRTLAVFRERFRK